MLRTFRLLLTLAVLEGTLPMAVAEAQTPVLNLDPIPGVVAPPVDPLPGLPHPPDVPASLMKPASGSHYGCADLPEPYFVPDPLLDRPDFAPPGWFLDAEVGFAGPHIIGVQSNAGTPVGNVPDFLFVPAAGLDWTVSPSLQIGYRLPSAFGEFALSYRFLATDGNGSTAGFDGPAALRTRLNFNVIDLDYLSREFSLAPHWDMKWHIGLRLAELYYDSRADEALALAAAGSTMFEQRFSNSYWGIGPHAGVELQRAVVGTGLSFVGKVDAATLLGRIRQGFFEQSTTLAPNGQFTAFEDRYSGSQDVPIVSLQAGVSWRPTEFPQVQLFLGYNFEYWWNVGKLSNIGTAAALSDQEILLRLTCNY